MSYAIQTIKEDGLVEFLLNPYKRITYLGTRILQKYPKDHLSDDLFIFETSDKCCCIYGRIDYLKKEIIADKPYLLNYEVTRKPPFFTFKDLKLDLQDKMKNDLEMMKVTKLAEIKLNPEYIRIYDECRGKHLQPMIFELLGTCDYCPNVRAYKNDGISRFLDLLSLDNMANIMYGKVDLVNKELERILISKNFLLSEILIPTLRAEAKEIVDTKKFSQRHLHLINYIKKTKDCGATRFTIETTSGEKLICHNRIHSDGSVVSTGKLVKSIDFESIEKVTYKSKVIYKKDVFL